MRQNLCVRRMNFDAVDAGLIHCEQNIYREYVDQSRDEWQRKILPTLKRLSLARLMSGDVGCLGVRCWILGQAVAGRETQTLGSSYSYRSPVVGFELRPFQTPAKDADPGFVANQARAGRIVCHIRVDDYARLFVPRV